MQNPEIQIHLIASSSIDRDATRTWLDSIGAAEFKLPGQEVSDPELLVGLAAKRCYRSYVAGDNPNVSRVRTDWLEYLGNILEQGHGSVAEHATFTFALENVTRVLTAELNRHRAGVAISEQSLRYVRFTDLPFWMPPSIREDSTSSDQHLEWQKRETRESIRRLMDHVRDEYLHLVNKVWKFEEMTKFHQKKVITSMLRRILPMGICTGAVYTFNIRALRHIIALRTSDAAEEEIAWVFTRVGKMMVERLPMLMSDFTLVDDKYWVPKHPKI